MNKPTDDLRLFDQTGPAEQGSELEVVIGIGPAFGERLRQTISGLDHEAVLREIVEGVRAEGIGARIVRVFDTSDCAFIGHEAAKLSGSGVGIGIQSKGTAVIHQKDLAPLTNLELFSMAPSLTLNSYHAIGRNAALYASGQPVSLCHLRLGN